MIDLLNRSGTHIGCSVKRIKYSWFDDLGASRGVYQLWNITKSAWLANESFTVGVQVFTGHLLNKFLSGFGLELKNGCHPRAKNINFCFRLFGGTNMSCSITRSPDGFSSGNIFADCFAIFSETSNAFGYNLPPLKNHCLDSLLM